jgi:chitodextrinase
MGLLFLGGIIGILFPLFFCLADEVDTSADVTSFAAPSNLTATVVSTTQIDLSWSAVSEAVSYKVYRDGTHIASPTTTSYSDTGLVSGTTYSYTVSAVDAYGIESEQSSAISATTFSVGGGGVPSQWYNPPQAPEEGFSVLINDGAEYTYSLKVTLTLKGGPDTERMAISNFPDFKGAGQEPYITSKEWNLCTPTPKFGVWACPEGEYSVYVKFYAPWGTSSEIVSDTIIFRKEKPIIEKIKEVPEEIEKGIKEISEKASELAKKVAKLIKPKEKIPPPPPPPEVPLVFQGKWTLLTYTLENKPFLKFTLSPLPKEIQKLAEKFPELGKTFKEVGIAKLIDIEKLRPVKLTLPGLTEKVGLPTLKIEPGKFALPQGVPVAKLSPEIKQKVPTEIVFAKTGGQLIDFNIALSITEKGEPQQRITTISGKPLQLVVKPEKPVKSVKGYVVFKSKKTQPTSFQFPFNHLTASLLFANPVFAKPQEKPVRVEEKLVLLEFEYTDPDGDGIYTAEIQAPIVEGEYEIITVMDYEDPTLGKKEIRLITVVDPEGYIYEKVGQKETRIPGAIVSLFWLNSETKQYELWPAKEYQQENPQTTDVRGTYSFLVPEGYYSLKVEAPGYLVYDGKPFQVKEGSGIHFNIELKTKYWWLKIIDWKTVLLIAVIILLLYNFYRDRIREKYLKRISK